MEEDERRKICELIERWNGSRLDMFAISCPDENMEFHGVIRFFLHEQQQQSPATGTAATKCMRVSSAHSVACVVHALVAKFHADMRMLAPASAYALWELHNDDNGAVAEQQQQRRMDAGERPLLVQLGWCCCTDEQGSGGGGMREGRFVLRRADAPATPPVVQSPSADFVRCIPRRFSKRRQAQAVPATTTTSALVGGSVKSVGGGKKRLQLRNNEIGTPRHLYDTVPPASSSPPPPPPLLFSPNALTPFARTLSNPELVLKRRREQKLDEQLRHMSNSGGGSLKIYGVELFPQRPYVTLLVNATDSAKRVVRAALDKYGLEQADSSNYALAEVFLMESDAMSRSFSDLRSIEKQRERLLYASERPLQLLAEHSTSNNVVFFLRCRPSTPAMSGSSYTLDRLFPSLHRNNDELVAAHPNHHHHHHQQKGRHVDDDADVDDHDRLMRRMVNDGVVVSAGGKQTVAAAAQFPSSSLPLLLPCLVPINAFASTANFGAGAVAIQPGVTEIGSSSACAIQLRAPSVLPRHCALHYRPNSSSVENNSQQQLKQQQQEAEDVPEREGEVIVSLLDKSALVELDGASTHADVRLQNGVQLRIGGVYCYRFFSNNSNNNSGGVDHGECAPPATDHIAEHDGTGMSQHRMQKEKLPSSSASVSFSSGPFNSATTVVHCIDPQHHQQQSEAALIVQNIFSPSVSFEQSNSNEYVELYKSSPLVGTPSSTTATPTSVAEQEQMLSLMPSAQQQKQQALQHNQTHHMHNQFHNNHDSSMRSPYKLPSSSPSSTSILPVYQHQQQQLPPRSAATLPILIECTDWRSEVELFKSELFATTNNNNNNNMATTTGSSTVGQQFGAFRLTPAFVLYAICRHRLHVSQSAAYDEERCRRLVGNTFAMFIDNCSRTIKVNHASRETLVFWLSNASELLNMGRTDAWLARAVGTALLDELAHVVQQLFTLLVEHCGQQLLGQGIQPIVQQWMLLLLRNRGAAGAPATATAAQQDGVPSLLVVAALDECLRTVRWALLNPALTIQLFSQLFHFISTTVFNWLVTEPEARPLICQQFGLLELKQLLDHVQQWAEQQGLELAAECHMDRLCQVVHLLCTPKNLQQVAVLGATCYRLNSVQVRFLLENYVGDVHAGETPAVSRELIEHVVALARQQQADDHHQQPSADGSMASSSAPQLTESTTLQLPFLLPHDGYVVEKLRGIPPDMATFVNALQQKGLVRVFVHQQQQAAASPSPLRHGAVPAEMPLSSWNVHMRHQQPSSSSSASAQCLPGKRSASITPSSSAFPTVVAPGAVAVGAAGAVTMFPPTPTPPPHQQRQLFNNGSSSSVAAGDSPVYAEIRRHNGGFQQHPQQQHPLAPPPPIRCQSASVFGTHHNTTNNNNGSNNNNQQQQQLQKKKKSNGYPNQQQHQQQQHQWNERLIDAEGVQQLLVERITLCRPSGKSGGGGIGLSIVEVVG
uniref:Ras-associating domain-containing protein n=1 Tax=Globodera rostochiensis TaxID=31243 RepID=A0A914I3K9_GLORO